MSDKLLVIDGHSIAFRAFYGLPADGFMTSTGQYTNAVYGFASMLANLITSTKPSHLGVAFDLSRVSFRTGEYADYKGTRGETPEAFIGQTELIHELLDAAGIPHLGLEGYEADDILATWATQGRQAGMQVLVCSGDRDLFQLVTDDVTVLYPIKGVTELAQMTPQAVLDRYGVTPQGYPDLAALVGESSDNLPGVPGVGPKTAVKWLHEYGSLDDLLLRADQVPGKVGQSLRDHIDDVRRNRHLNALVTDLPLELGAHDLHRQPADVAEVRRLFDVLEFNNLRTRFLAALDQPDLAPPQVAAPTASRTLAAIEPGGLGAWLAAQTGAPTGVLLTLRSGEADTIWLAGQSEVLPVGVANLALADEQSLAAWLGDDGRAKSMHAAKPQLRALAAQGWVVRGLVMDTELAAYLLRPDQRSLDLETLSEQYLKRPLEAGGDGAAQATLDFLEADDQSRARVEAIADLAVVMAGELRAVAADKLLADVELPVQQVLARMETVGIAADEDAMRDLRDELDAAVVAAEQAAYDVIGHEINLGSPKQLQTVLFDELHMPKSKKTKQGYTTGAAALDEMYAANPHPFLEHLLAHRDNIKLRQIVDALMRAIADDGRIHTTYQQTVTSTGRLSSTDPNLQNIPVRTETGRRVREAFVAGHGYDGLLSADYSQIEMRVMAHVSGDPALIEAFRSGVDFHTVTASHVFRVPADEITPAQRSKVKQVNYGLAYGLSAFGLSARLGIDVGEARDLMDGYFATFGHVREYLDAVVEQARKTGYTETLLGRRRYLPDLTSMNRQRREMAERAALNAPIQGTAADIIKLAMVRAAARLHDDHLSSRLLLQVHDELVFEVAPGERDALTKAVTDVMSGAMQLAVPLDVSIGFGPSWAEAH